jgi:hypothetical protein
MKTKLLLILIVIGTQQLHAQFETGKKLVSGQLGLGFSNDKVNSTTNTDRITSVANLQVSLSRFLSPTALKGFGFNYGYDYAHNNINNPGLDQKGYAHLFGAFITRTKLHPLAKKFYLSFSGTLGAGYGFGKIKYTNIPGSTDTKTMYTNIFGSLGVWYQLSPRFILSGELSNLFNLSYRYNSGDVHSGTNNYKYSQSSINFNTGLSGTALNNLSIGVRYILR